MTSASSSKKVVSVAASYLSVPTQRLQSLEQLRSKTLGSKLAKNTSTILFSHISNNNTNSKTAQRTQHSTKTKKITTSPTYQQSNPTQLISKRQQLLDYYPPDINVHQLANQDLSLNSLELQDVKFEILKEREMALEARGKTIRVSVVDGLRPYQDKSSKKKKKK